MYPMGVDTQILLPKSHKKDTPLRLILSSRGAVIWGCKRTCKNPGTPHSHSPSKLKTSRTLWKHVKNIKLGEKECTSHANLYNRITMSIQLIIILVGFCLKNLCFLFQGRFYEQVQEVAMGVTHKPDCGQHFWRTLRSRQSAHQQIPQDYGEVCRYHCYPEDGTQSCWSTSTPLTPISSSLQKRLV